jgi:hypothetical protein
MYDFPDLVFVTEVWLKSLSENRRRVLKMGRQAAGTRRGPPLTCQVRSARARALSSRSSSCFMSLPVWL